MALRFTEGSAFNPFNFRASDRGRSFPAATAIPKRYGTVCGPVSEFTAFKKCYHYSGVWLERQGSNLHNWLMYTPQCVIHFHHVPLIAGLSRLPYGLMPRFRVFRQHPQLQHRSLRGIVQDFLPHPNIVPGGQRYCTSTGGESNHDQFAESDCASRCHSVQLYLRASTENWCGQQESNLCVEQVRPCPCAPLRYIRMMPVSPGCRSSFTVCGVTLKSQRTFSPGGAGELNPYYVTDFRRAGYCPIIGQHFYLFAASVRITGYSATHAPTPM